MQLRTISIRRTGPILLARAALIQTPNQPVNALFHSAMHWAHAANLTIRDKRDMGVSGVVMNTATPARRSS